MKWLNKTEIDLVELLWLVACLVVTGIGVWIAPEAFTVLGKGLFEPPVSASEARQGMLVAGLTLAGVGLCVSRLTQERLLPGWKEKLKAELGLPAEANDQDLAQAMPPKSLD